MSASEKNRFFKSVMGMQTEDTQLTRIMATYRKYAYWANQVDAQGLKDNLTAQGLEVVEPHKAVCIPLSRRSEIGIVPPDTWKNADLCGHFCRTSGEQLHRGPNTSISVAPCETVL